MIVSRDRVGVNSLESLRFATRPPTRCPLRLRGVFLSIDSEDAVAFSAAFDAFVGGFWSPSFFDAMSPLRSFDGETIFFFFGASF